MVVPFVLILGLGACEDSSPRDPSARLRIDPPTALPGPGRTPVLPHLTALPQLGTTVQALPEPEPPACVGVGSWFTDVTTCAGVSAVHIQTTPQLFGSNFVTGQAFVDVDGDRWLDVVLASPNGWGRLFLGGPDGSFTPREEAGLDLEHAHAVLAADFDADGRRDVFLAGTENRLLEAAGDQLLEVDTPGGPSTTLGASAVDLDGDGLLELYLANHACVDCGEAPPCAGQQDELWSRGPSGWTEQTEAFLGGAPVSPCGLGFVGVWSDLDGDGDLDLYVGNDRGSELAVDDAGVPCRRNLLWRNDGPGCGGHCFTEVARDAGLAAFTNTMGIDTGDFDNDGDLDVALTDSGPTRVFANDGTGGFVDVSQELRISQPMMADAWGVVWLDVDNDGDLDLYSTASGSDVLYLNEPGAFAEVPVEDLPDSTGPTRGLAVADYDRDGALDLLTGRNGGAWRLLRNQVDSGNHWLGLQLLGHGAGGTDALGAVVRVTDDSGRTQLREVKAGFSNGGGSDLGVHFGLGESEPVEVAITWPDGVTEIVDPQLDRWSVVTRR